MTQKTILNDSPPRARREDGRLRRLGHAAQLRLADRRTSSVRRDAGMFDVSHMTVVDLRGARTREFLRHLLANSVDKLQGRARRCTRACSTMPAAVIDDLIVYFLAEDFFRVVVNAATRDKDLAWIEQQARAFEVKVTERPELAMIAVQGPNARAKVFGLLSPETRAKAEKLGKFAAIEGDGLFIARTGYTGEDGFEIVVPEMQAVDVVEPPEASRRRPGRARCTRHAAPGSRHESLRPGHGRDGVAVGGESRLDGRARRGPQFHRP
jgi:aminomethyltransferase